MAVEAPRTYINIALTRASLGEAEDVFAFFRTKSGGVVGYVPRKDITVDEQQVGPELSAKLSVKIIESGDDYDLAEVQLDPGQTVKLRVDRKTHQIVPIKSKSVYYE